MSKQNIAVAVVMYCRDVLRLRSLAWMTALVSLTLISLNLTPRAASAQEKRGVRSLIYFADRPPSIDLGAVLLNANAAETTNADQLWSGGGLGLNLTGAGINVGIWDEGAVRGTQQELMGRVSVVHGVPEPATLLLLGTGALGLLLLLRRRNAAASA